MSLSSVQLAAEVNLDNRTVYEDGDVLLVVSPPAEDDDDRDGGNKAQAIFQVSAERLKAVSSVWKAELEGRFVEGGPRSARFPIAVPVEDDPAAVNVCLDVVYGKAPEAFKSSALALGVVKFADNRNILLHGREGATIRDHAKALIANPPFAWGSDAVVEQGADLIHLALLLEDKAAFRSCTKKLVEDFRSGDLSALEARNGSLHHIDFALLAVNLEREINSIRSGLRRWMEPILNFDCHEEIHKPFFRIVKGLPYRSLEDTSISGFHTVKRHLDSQWNSYMAGPKEARRGRCRKCSRGPLPLIVMERFSRYSKYARTGVVRPNGMCYDCAVAGKRRACCVVVNVTRLSGR